MLIQMMAIGLMLQQEPAKTVEVGDRVPDVAFQDMSGKAVRLSDYFGKKIILFNWASW